MVLSMTLLSPIPAAAWKLQSASLISATPTQISSPAFDDSSWLPATVPGTVLTSYLNAGKIPDPFYADQRFKIDDAFFTNNDFWYRNTFTVAPLVKQRLWLNFDGINWKANVYVNGEHVGDVNGSFIRGKFDITKLVRADSVICMAVLIHKVAHPGSVKPKSLKHWLPNGGELGLDSPTFISSIGWNWLPTIPGRNIGIWNDVRFTTSGDVTIDDPFVITDLPLPHLFRADLRIQCDLTNHSLEEQRGILRGELGDIHFDQPITLASSQTSHIVIDKALAHPNLWWPNGMGEQPLYHLKLQFIVGDRASDTTNTTFGIRKLTYAIHNNVLFLSVNGHRVLIRGGNWGMDEGMLRCDAAGYDARVRLHREMNFNMIRNWCGLTARDAFYDACDRYGLLVWDDFWLANPSDGPDPTDHAMFLANAVDKIRRVRSHPSLALYCGRNEGYPPKAIDDALRSATTDLDGSRYYLSNSAADVVTGHGPYDVRSPEWYFAHRGDTLHSELGIVAVPPIESLRQMFPPDKLWPINDLWGQHDLSQERGPAYLKRLADSYGPAKDVEDFCRKAQLLNLESAQAMLESWQSRQGSGGLIWMTQAAWPCLICQAYAYDFEPTGAYFGFRKACEPLHILWDRHTNQIKVANDTIEDAKNLTAQADLYNLDGSKKWTRSIAINAPAGSATTCFDLQFPASLSDVFFVRLILTRGPATLSDNFYWEGKTPGRYQSLSTLAPVDLTTSATFNHDDPRQSIVTAAFQNPTSSIAFAIHLTLHTATTNQRVLPAFYGDNYFTLLPGQSKAVSIEFDEGLLHGEKARLQYQCWNGRPREISV
jgi:hypothetical protein